MDLENNKESKFFSLFFHIALSPKFVLDPLNEVHYLEIFVTYPWLISGLSFTERTTHIGCFCSL